MSFQFDKKALFKAQKINPIAFDESAFFHQEICRRLFEHLDFISLTPISILDLGAKTGYSTQLFQQRYPDANIIAIDYSPNLLKNISGKVQKISADPEILPFASQSFDLIFSNLLLTQVVDLEKTITEIRRVLRPQGLFLFSLLGSDTLSELRESFYEIDNSPHVHAFMDMHDVGDFLLQQKFLDPVMETEHLTLYYRDLNLLFKDIKATGNHNIAAARNKHLMGKKHWQQLIHHYEKYRNEKKLLPVTFEIMYGHAWGTVMNSDRQEIRINVSSIGGRKNS